MHELQITKLEHLFNIIDFNHNGLLTKSDFEGIADNVAIFAGVLEETKKRVGRAILAIEFGVTSRVTLGLTISCTLPSISG